MREQSRALLLIGLALLLRSFVLLSTPTPVQAQAVPDLVVTLRDGAGAGISGATITVHDRDGAGVLAQVQTDATGTATIPTALMNDVRVAVTGRMTDGTPLKQLDTDTGGIALFLDGAQTTHLDLRVEDDGTVIPDPQTMLVPEVVPSSAATVQSTRVSSAPHTAVATVQPTVPVIAMVTPASADTLTSTVPVTPLPVAMQVVIVIGSLILLALVARLVIYVVQKWGL